MNCRIMHERLLVCVALLLATLSAAARAQQQPVRRVPHIGYVYPAGGKQGSTFEVTVGGQFLDGVSDVRIFGGGARATVVEHVKPLTPQQATQLRDKLKELLDRKLATAASSRPSTKPAWTAGDQATLEDIRVKLATYIRKPSSPAIAEMVTLKITLASDAPVGQRELRLKTPLGLTNPLAFCVGQFPEFSEQPARSSGEPTAAAAKKETEITLPAVVNGQVLPGGVNRYRFQARRGQHLVVATSARALIPYLADAVPGWFQPTLTLYDADGREIAYDDDFRFNPDPVLYFVVPRDGDYGLEIKDAIFRGREDFVYRISIGEFPFVTSIFPLGGPAGGETNVALSGWNLPTQRLKWETEADVQEPGVRPVVVRKGTWISNPKPFAADTVPQCAEIEPNSGSHPPQRVTLPIVVNGRVERSGDEDVFRFPGKKGDQIVAEVWARRLDSPLDSSLEITDESGTRIAFNDDYEDKGAALVTHQADSWLQLTLPHDGDYDVHLADTQHKGGGEYAYRLRISAPKPDFELRVEPSAVNVRAGATAALTVHALRRDGFEGEITLELVDAPSGVVLSGGRILAGQDQVHATISAPPASADEPIQLRVLGRTRMGEREVTHAAVPADDMMQAFAYHHLVPANELLITVLGRPMFRSAISVLNPMPLKIRAGGVTGIHVRVPPGSRWIGQASFEISEPQGMAVQSVIAAERDQMQIAVRCDAEKIKPGLKGNMIIEAFAERPATATTTASGDAKSKLPTRRLSLGLLPAISFEVVESEPRTSAKRVADAK